MQIYVHSIISHCPNLPQKNGGVFWKNDDYEDLRRVTRL